jgi:2-polyprenyl-3-methyl-5-hydroxy-6-metoxy-1,4-benzoquinol methylase
MREYKKIKTSFGFWQATPLPSKKEVDEYFRDHYYQDMISLQYSTKYSNEEICFKYNKCLIAETVIRKFRDENIKSLIDVGCGEGYLLDYFYQRGWKVTGVDTSSFGIEQHNPHLFPFFRHGDISDILCEMIAQNETFDIVTLIEVLMHTIQPELILNSLKKIMHKNSVLVLTIANNFSPFQLKLLENQKVNTEYWFTPPDHLQYFTLPTLSSLLQNCGFDVLFSYADFPIEIFLANEHSNYYTDRSKGKESHNARVFIDNFLVEQGIEKYLNFMHSMAEIGLGRNFTVLAQINP